MSDPLSESISRLEELERVLSSIKSGIAAEFPLQGEGYPQQLLCRLSVAVSERLDANYAFRVRRQRAGEK